MWCIMRIEELEIGQNVTLQVMIGAEQLEFPISVMESAPKKHGIFTSAIMKDDKVLSFKAPGIFTHLIVSFTETKPHIFDNVEIQTLKSNDGSYCYFISTNDPSKEFNRRGAFRCYLGLPGTVQVGVGTTGIDTTIKDISTTGFSFVLPASAKEIQRGSIAHVVLSDYMKETGDSFKFPLTGITVRSYKMDNGNVVYGCKLNAKVMGLDKYITMKERLRLNKSRQMH